MSRNGTVALNLKQGLSDQRRSQLKKTLNHVQHYGTIQKENYG